MCHHSLKSLFARYRIPEVLMSDNMPFNSRSFCDFANDWNFDLVWSCPRYPQSNGMVERSVQTVKMLLKKAKSEDGSTLRRNRRHLRSTAEEPPTIAPHPLDESDTRAETAQPPTVPQPPAANASLSSPGQPQPPSCIRRSTRAPKLQSDLVITS